jgi:fumarate reductase flavoprotein subunit
VLSHAWSRVRCRGGLLFSGTDLQVALGIEDDGEKLREDILKCGRGKNDPATVDVYIRHQLDTYNWMVTPMRRAGRCRRTR